MNTRVKIILLFLLLAAAAWGLTGENVPEKVHTSRHSTASTAKNPSPNTSQLIDDGDVDFDEYGITPLPRRPIEDEELPDGDLPDDIASRPIISSVVLPTIAPTPTFAKPPATPTLFAPTPILRASNVAPPIEALQELAAQGDTSNRIHGIRVAGADPTPVASPLPTLGTPEPTPTPLPLRARVSGQPRGYVMLPLMLQKARAAMERQIDILLASEVNDLYVSTLVDGTFSEDFEYLESVVRRLNVGSRTLTFEIYLASGPTMRRWNKTPIQTLFSVISPEDFRWQIAEDSTVREEVTRLAKRSRTVFDLNKSLNTGNQNLIAVMLEDNLDYDSYGVMRSLVRKSIGDSATFIRNACPGCTEGSDSDPQGDGLELHEVSQFPELTLGDGYTLDGVRVLYPGETGSGAITIDDLKTMLTTSVATGHKFFGLWRAQRQGLGDQLTHPENRTYEVASPAHEEIEIDLLRHGLTPVIVKEPAPSEPQVDSRLFDFSGG